MIYVRFSWIINIYLTKSGDSRKQKICARMVFPGLPQEGFVNLCKLFLDWTIAYNYSDTPQNRFGIQPCSRSEPVFYQTRFSSTEARGLMPYHFRSAFVSTTVKMPWWWRCQQVERRSYPNPLLHPTTGCATMCQDWNFAMGFANPSAKDMVKNEGSKHQKIYPTGA